MKCKKGLNPIGDVFFALCKSVNSPTSLGLWLCFKHGDYDSVVKHAIDPASYLNAETFEADYRVVSYLSKYRDLETTFDLRAEALSSFKTAEVDCLSTNRRIRTSLRAGFEPAFESCIFMAQKKIAKLLGPFSLHKVIHGCGWGPGATFEYTRKDARLDNKIGKPPFSVTQSALPTARSVIENDLHWSSVLLGVNPEDIQGAYSLTPQNFEIVKGCRITTVPKNAKTDRTIAIEPRLNGFLQKGVGHFIRSRLATVGVDLNNQEINQDGARRAHLENLATLDLKAASDSICLELVYLLLPVDWAMYLDDIRSQYYLLEKEWYRFEKISSMGNGFTFELESLIFWALGSSVLTDPDPQQQSLLVYGDDIVIPSSVSDKFSSLLSLLGFTLNKAKSFTKGQFFESCGKHYFGGTDVTPIYQKEPIADPIENVRAYNRVVRNRARRLGIGKAIDLADPILASIMRLASEEFLKYRIPLGAEGDDAYLTESSNLTCDPNGIYTCLVFSRVGKRQRLWNAPLYAFSLFQQNRSQASEGVGALSHLNAREGVESGVLLTAGVGSKVSTRRRRIYVFEGVVTPRGLVAKSKQN